MMVEWFVSNEVGGPTIPCYWEVDYYQTNISHNITFIKQYKDHNITIILIILDYITGLNHNIELLTNVEHEIPMINHYQPLLTHH